MIPERVFHFSTVLHPKVDAVEICVTCYEILCKMKYLQIHFTFRCNRVEWTVWNKVLLTLFCLTRKWQCCPLQEGEYMHSDDSKNNIPYKDERK